MKVNYLNPSSPSLGQEHFQIRVSMCTAKHKLATFGTTCVFKLVKRLRLSSVTERNGNRNAPTVLTEWVPEGQIITLLTICKSWQHYESEFVRIGQSWRHPSHGSCTKTTPFSSTRSTHLIVTFSEIKSASIGTRFESTERVKHKSVELLMLLQSYKG